LSAQDRDPALRISGGGRLGLFFRSIGEVVAAVRRLFDEPGLTAGLPPQPDGECETDEHRGEADGGGRDDPGLIGPVSRRPTHGQLPCRFEDEEQGRNDDGEREEQVRFGAWPKAPKRLLIRNVDYKRVFHRGCVFRFIP
jgi:hypothetical protein